MRVSFKQHEEKDFVDVHTGRDGKDVVSRVATAEDMVRWPEEYAVYLGQPAADVTEAASTYTAPSVETPAPTTKSKKKG
ncbi:hypothetical protein [Corallococcus silvisoli]|uniref:hypothetical protein n=1 Tax=Corallococcus silvisoli TaxID=2697031 RepID=UPI00137753B0|nr:hypothetical protein [Corallococcus silvisoli]NBD11828.1 hypothetical protein [Corallococcus silvisoli]